MRDVEELLDDPEMRPRPLAFAIVFGENAKTTSATPKSPTGRS